MKTQYFALAIFFLIIGATIAGALYYYIGQSDHSATPGMPNNSPTNSIAPIDIPNTPSISPEITSTISPTNSATQTPLQGNVQGKIEESVSKKQIAGATIFLCPIVSEYECELIANLNKTSQNDGSFTFDAIQPGSYVVVYGLKEEINLTGKEWAGRKINYQNLSALASSFSDKEVLLTAAEGGMMLEDNVITKIIGGSVLSGELGLTLEFRDGKPLMIEARAGKTANIEITVSEPQQTSP